MNWFLIFIWIRGRYRRKDLWEEVKEDAAKIHAAGKKAYYVFPSVFRKNASDFYLGSLKKTGQLFFGWSGGKESGCSLVCTQVSAADANDPGSGAIYLQSQGTGNIA